MTSPGSGMSMRGVVDLGALAAAREAEARAQERLAQDPPDGPEAWSLDVTEASFQRDVMDQSFVVPVVIDLWATWCGPCTQLSPVLERLAQEYAGRLVLAKVDVDANPRISQAFQVQSIPTVIAVIKGQPVPLFQGALPEPAVREVLDELLRVAAANGLTGTVGGVVEGGTAPDDAALDETEPPGDPRFDAAYEAVDRGDWDAAEAAYREVLASDPADPDAQAGLGQVALLRRTDGVDPAEVLARAQAEPDSVTAQSTAADVELLTGRVDEAFDRLVALVRRTAGEERTAARDHLVALFALVGDADPRVARARTELANALF